MRYLLFVTALAACGPPAYYVANVYADQGGMFTERCPIDSGKHGDKPDPDHCRYERVGPLPPEVAAKFNVAPPPSPMEPPPPPPPPPPAP